MKELLQSLKNPKTIGLIILAVLVLVGLPLLLYEVQQQQEVRQRAATQVTGADTCGHIQVTASDGGVCPNGHPSGPLNSYNTSYTLTNSSSSSITLTYLAQTYFCSSPSKVGASSCLQCPQNPNGTVTIPAGGSKTVSGPTRSPNADSTNNCAPATFSNCGWYQNDFSFQYSLNGQTCTFGSLNGVQIRAFGWCNTQIDCTAITPSPTPTTVITPTATPTISLTPTPTTGITPTVTLTPTPSVTNTPTPTPTGTLTPTPTGTTPTPTPTSGVTPTPTPTNPPGPTATPTPTRPFVPTATLTPKPPLPPTGPENNVFVNIGIIGSVLTVLGGLLLFGL